MIDLIFNRPERRFDVREIDDPSQVIIYGAADMYLYTEGVSVQATALVSVGHMGQSMSCFYSECFEYFHVASFIESQGIYGPEGSTAIGGREGNGGLRHQYSSFALDRPSVVGRSD